MPDYTELELIALQASRIAQNVVERQYAQYPELKRFGIAGYKQSLDDAIFNMSYLIAALRYDSQPIFTNYIKWTHALFESLSLPKELLKLFYDLFIVELQALEKESLVSKATIVHITNYIADAFKAIATIMVEASPQQERASWVMPYYEAYEQAIHTGNRTALNQLFKQLEASHIPIADIYEHLMCPVQRSLGEMWRNNTISVAQEHFATAMSQYAMTLLYPQIFGTSKNGYRAVLACAQGELHEFGIRLIADYFEHDGWDTYFYGANTPVKDLLQAILDKSPDIIILSCTMPQYIHSIEQIIRELKSRSVMAPIFVGGYPFDADPTLFEKVKADHYTSYFKETLREAKAILGI